MNEDIRASILIAKRPGCFCAYRTNRRCWLTDEGAFRKDEVDDEVEGAEIEGHRVPVEEEVADADVPAPVDADGHDDDEQRHEDARHEARDPAGGAVCLFFGFETTRGARMTA